MSAPKKPHQPERHIRIRSVQRDQPDLRKLASAVIGLALAQAEAEAQAQHEQQAPDKDQASQTTLRIPPKKGAA